jgi:hypothetical protein
MEWLRKAGLCTGTVLHAKVGSIFPLYTEHSISGVFSTRWGAWYEASVQRRDALLIVAIEDLVRFLWRTGGPDRRNRRRSCRRFSPLATSHSPLSRIGTTISLDFYRTCMVNSESRLGSVSLYGLLLSPEPLPTLTHHRFLSRLVSSTYKSLFSQVFCFLIYTKPRGWRTPALRFCCSELPTTHYPLSFLLLVDSLAQLQNSSPFLSRKSELFQQKCRGVASRRFHVDMGWPPQRGTGFSLCSDPSFEFAFRFSDPDVQTFQRANVKCGVGIPDGVTGRSLDLRFSSFDFRCGLDGEFDAGSGAANDLSCFLRKDEVFGGRAQRHFFDATRGDFKIVDSFHPYGRAQKIFPEDVVRRESHGTNLPFLKGFSVAF